MHCLQTIAEKKGWELSKSEGFELVTIMPSLVLGPVTGTRPDGTSINAMKVAAILLSGCVAHTFLLVVYSPSVWSVVGFHNNYSEMLVCQRTLDLFRAHCSCSWCA